MSEFSANIITPANKGELLRVFNPLADLYFTVRDTPQHRYLRIETRHFCGAEFLYQTRLRRKLCPEEAIAQFSFAALEHDPFLGRSMLHYDRQTEMLYAFEDAHTDIWQGVHLQETQILQLMEHIASDYGIETPSLVIDPALPSNEYDPLLHQVLLSPEGGKGKACSPEVVVHEMAHAVMRDLDQYVSHHHPYFARLLVGMYADYLGYNRDVLFARGREFGIFGPLDPFATSQWPLLPQAVSSLADAQQVLAAPLALRLNQG